MIDPNGPVDEAADPEEGLRNIRAGLWAVAAVYDFVVFIALLVIGVWSTWHPGAIVLDGFEWQVLATWFWVGVVPGVVITFGVWLAHERLTDRINDLVKARL